MHSVFPSVKSNNKLTQGIGMTALILTVLQNKGLTNKSILHYHDMFEIPPKGFG
jgi:hypothetical protein